MRQFNPGIVAYKNIETVKSKTAPAANNASGLLAPKKNMTVRKDNIQPYERVAEYVRSIREQREAYKNGNA